MVASNRAGENLELYRIANWEECLRGASTCSKNKSAECLGMSGNVWGWVGMLMKCSWDVCGMSAGSPTSSI